MLQQIAQWIGMNKEWLFSGVGITLVLMLIWLARKFRAVFRKDGPIVSVRYGFYTTPLGSVGDGMAITIQNTTQRTLHLGNFLVGMRSRENIFVPQDELTGQTQQKRQVSPGDSFTFHIPAHIFAEIGKDASEYTEAIVEDAAGPPYKSHRGELSKAIRFMLARAATRQR